MNKSNVRDWAFVYAVFVLVILGIVLQIYDLQTTLVSLHKHGCGEEGNPRFANIKDPLEFYDVALEAKVIAILGFAALGVLSVYWYYHPTLWWISLVVLGALLFGVALYIGVVIGNIDVALQCIRAS